jgi:hypothetical protein
VILTNCNKFVVSGVDDGKDKTMSYRIDEITEPFVFVYTLKKTGSLSVVCYYLCPFF